MVYFLGRDVAVTIKAGDNIGVEADSTFSYAGGAAAEFASATGVAVSDLTGVDLGIGVTDEDVTYIGSRTVLKAEIKKETTISLTRKKSDNVWDAIFNGGARWGVPADATSPIANVAGEPNVSSGVTFGYQIEITLKGSPDGELFTVKNAQITGHAVTLSADGTTEETLEFVSQIDPVITAVA
tara:strand:- start:34 stop:582 length:549 start_codon:yes stop_codon:yes gene_type:complete